MSEYYCIINEGEKVDETAEVGILEKPSKNSEEDEAIFNLHFNDGYSICDQALLLKAPIITSQLSTSSLNNRKGEKQVVILEQVIIEYNAEFYDKYQSFDGNMFSYLVNYVSVGIPTQKYNLILKDASKLLAQKIERSFSTQADGYTWLIAAMRASALECLVYSSELDSLVCVGKLRDKMRTLKSNMIGVGHFQISITHRNYERYFLKFILRKFQLTNTTQTCSKPPQTIYKIEPPTEVMKALLNNNN